MRTELTETELKLKEDLPLILNGGYDKFFEGEQLKLILELSFLYNFTEFTYDSAVFKYNNNTLRISGLSDAYYSVDSFDTAVNYIRKERVFKDALVSYKREYKINNIIENDNNREKN